MRDEAVSLAKAKLQAAMLKGVLVLIDSLDDNDQALRLRAARITVETALKSEENDELRHRIEVLDNALTLLKRQL